jgi:hypothetical protein
MQLMEIQDAAELIRMEYAEMPGLQLTFWQVQRLCNLSEELCDRALSRLMGTGFLVLTYDRRYTRPHPERSVADPPVPLRRAI